ncbi:thioredoxin domain-containing protein [uncultured Actinomyces sp.]|uniref:DsbA family protein n=1 Tax=uncultured Actinomyces sp. TaxID=249061 RepID=UPI0028F16863|nr:thioredoxin domain-containing protein [uncultured Actinomyces sp.]
MAKPSRSQEVREKAQQLREQQARADRRTRNIIIGLVALILVVIIGAIAAVIIQSNHKKAQDSQAATAAIGAFEDGAPIVVSHLGIGKVDESLPTLTQYFDYSCHVCAAYDVAFGEQAVQDALDGKFNIKYQPVNTVKAPYQYAATTASLIAAQKVDAQTWGKFHNALLAYFNEAYNSGSGSVVQDLSKSAKQVKTIASQVGIPEDVVNSFPENAVDEYLTKTTQAWANANYEGRSANSLGTPEFVINGKTALDFSKFGVTTVDGVYPVIQQQLAAAGPASASN